MRLRKYDFKTVWVSAYENRSVFAKNCASANAPLRPEKVVTSAADVGRHRREASTPDRVLQRAGGTFRSRLRQHEHRSVQNSLDRFEIKKKCVSF